MQTLVVKHNTTVMDPDFLKARKFIRNKILQFLLQRQPQTNKIPPNKILDIVKRLEEGLYKAAATMEDYMNLDTLESRLHVFVKRPQFNNPRNSQFVNSSTHVSMMIPTPGLSHSESSNLVISSSMDNSVTASTCSKSSTASSRNWLQMANGACTGIHYGSVHSSDGCLSNGLQLSSANFSTDSGGNNIMSSKGGSGVVSQMIPTPGLNSSSNNISMIMESASNDSGFSNADSSLAPQRLPQKQPAGGQSDHVLQSLGSQMPGGVKSSVQSKLDALGFSETTTSSVKISPSTGDTSTIKTTKTPVSGDRFSPAKSVGPVLNNKNFSQVSLQHSPRPSSVTCNQSHQTNLRSPQSTSHVKSQSTDGSENLKFQSPQAQRENLLLSHQQYNEQSHQFVKHQKSASHQWQQKQARQQHQVSLAIDAFGLSQLSSDVRSHVRTEHVAEVPQAQISNFYEHLKLPDEFPQSSADKCGGSTQSSILPSDSHDTYLRLPQNPQHLLQSHLLGPEARIDSLPPGTQLNSLLGPWHSQSEDTSSLSGSLLHVNKVHEQFHQRIGVYDEAQCSSLPNEGSNFGLNPVKNSAGLHSSSSNFSRSANANRDRHFRNQQRWLLFLRHARRCAAPEGKCIDNCATVKKLCTHIDVCDVSHCSYPRCRHTKILIQHHKHCKETGCPVCAPVRKYLQAQLKARMCKQSDLSLQGSVSRSCKSSDDGKLNAGDTPNPYPIVEVMEDSEPSLKRLKAEPPSNSIIAENGIVVVPLQARNDAQVPLHLEAQEFQRNGASVRFKSEFIEVKMKTPEGSGPTMTVMKDGLDAPCGYNSVGGLMLIDSTLSGMQEIVEFEKGEGEIEQKDGLHSSEHGVGTKSGKPKINGVSLTELFTPEQIREHIRGLRQWVGQCKAKVEKNQAMKHTMSENSCQLCAVEKLNFEPPPIYCTRCGCRIKRNAMYYTSGAGDTRHYFCVPCYNEACGETMMVDGTAVPKARFEKKKNDEETEESWVQCDKCEAWQHQICALFNGRRNDGGQAEYTCPYCYIQEIESGERKPLPQSAVLGAKDLPRTVLSDHIEQRLLRQVKYERHERARIQGKSYDEVPGVEGIVVRVVSSVDKRLEVKSRFLETFREGNYPSEFPYKSKVILLFQKIEGVEVCLFAMYVQEFGSECQPPNQRRVYLSYLDSIKYFRPEVKAVTGEALRTYVYHEILIGYLAYCKKRGFTSCYIWACPPLKGEDYILYCHPEIQRTPKSDKLREWYLSMLKKASKENIVVELTNLYDHFFVSTGECKAKVTAARLPYFDGDYWPGAAEDTFEQLSQEDGRKLNKRGTTKKAFTKRNLKASGEADLCSNASKDLVLMHKLGETILPMKDDFIMVHLQYACSRCYVIMVSGNRWICKHCKDFKICHECYEAEQKLDEWERHPVGHKDMHTLYPIEITDVPEDTKDEDESLESEFFDTRQAFLSLCQGNHYQYDTLRRAKHSSMMVLYHLHNPTAPAFVTTCYICHLDIETGQGWRCETCPDYDVCNDCYEKGGINHPHKLTNHPSMGDRDTQSKEARQLRVVQLRKMLDLLVHASQCRSPHCQYPNCRKVKGLFRHGIQCKVRPSGGCVLCKKMWYLLQLHSRACKESDCHVPRCRDLKEHLRRLQQQSDSRRRAAVTEMMRQRAAEVAGKSG